MRLVISIVGANLAEKIAIKVGVENELFTLNDKGFIIPASKIVVKEIIQDILNKEVDIDLLKNLIYGIQWEPHPAQLEIVTQPLSYVLIEKAMRISRQYIADVAERKKIKIYGGSVHPIQSNPFPINGTHISISVFPRKRKGMTRKFLTYIHNNIRRHIPELIALTANSPIIAGNPSGYVSARLVYSRVLRPSNYAVIKRSKTTIIPREKRALLKYAFVFTDKKKYEHKVVANEVGLRFLDVTPRGPFTNIIEDRWSSPKVSRVEARFLDNPSNIDYLMDIIAILIGLSLEAVDKLYRNERIEEPPNLTENRRRAIKDGINATFIIDGATRPARECVIEMLQRVQTYLDMLGIKLRTSLAQGVPEIEYYGAPEIISAHNGIMKNIFLGKILMKVQLNGSRHLITIGGEKRRLKEKTRIFGLAFPEYNFEWDEDEHNIVSRFRKIRISYWLLTQHGYVRLMPDDRILIATSPIGKLVRLFNHIYKTMGF